MMRDITVSKDDSLPEVYGKLLKGKIDDARTVTEQELCIIRRQNSRHKVYLRSQIERMVQRLQEADY